MKIERCHHHPFSSAQVFAVWRTRLKLSFNQSSCSVSNYYFRCSSAHHAAHRSDKNHDVPMPMCNDSPDTYFSSATSAFAPIGLSNLGLVIYAVPLCWILDAALEMNSPAFSLSSLAWIRESTPSKEAIKILNISSQMKMYATATACNIAINHNVLCNAPDNVFAYLLLPAAHW